MSSRVASQRKRRPPPILPPPLGPLPVQVVDDEALSRFSASTKVHRQTFGMSSSRPADHFGEQDMTVVGQPPISPAREWPNSVPSSPQSTRAGNCSHREMIEWNSDQPVHQQGVLTSRDPALRSPFIPMAPECWLDGMHLPPRCMSEMTYRKGSQGSVRQMQRSWNRELTEVWLKSQDMGGTESAQDGILSSKSAVRDTDQHSTIANRRSFRVSRGALHQSDGRRHASIETLALQGIHAPWPAQVCGTESSSNDMASCANHTCRTSKPNVNHKNSEGTTDSAIDPGMDIDRQGCTQKLESRQLYPLPFVVLCDGREGQFRVSERYMNTLNSQDLVDLCLRATHGPSMEHHVYPTQLHVVLSHQTSSILGLSLHRAGFNLVPMEPWTTSEFPSMQFLLLKQFFLTVVERDGCVRLLCSGQGEPLPSALTASKRFWQPFDQLARHICRPDQTTQTDDCSEARKTASFATFTSLEKGVQAGLSAPLILSNHSATEHVSSQAYLRSLRGLSGLSSMMSSLEHALDEVNSSFQQRQDRPSLRRTFSAPQSSFDRNRETVLSSRFSEETEHEESLCSSGDIMTRIRRWNSGGQATCSSKPAATHTSSPASQHVSDQGSVTITRSQRLAAQLSIRYQRLGMMTSRAVSRVHSHREKNRLGSGMNHADCRSVLRDRSARVERCEEVSRPFADRAKPEKAFHPRLGKSMRLSPCTPRRTMPLSLDVAASTTWSTDYSPDPTSTPSTASIALPPELCASMSQHPDNNHACTSDMPTPVASVLCEQDAFWSEGSVVPETVFNSGVQAGKMRTLKASNAMEELSEHDPDDRQCNDDVRSLSLRSEISCGRSSFAGLRRMFGNLHCSSARSAALPAPPETPTSMKSTNSSSFAKRWHSLRSVSTVISELDSPTPMLVTPDKEMRSMRGSIVNMCSEQSSVDIDHQQASQLFLPQTPVRSLENPSLGDRGAEICSVPTTSTDNDQFVDTTLDAWRAYSAQIPNSGPMKPRYTQQSTAVLSSTSLGSSGRITSDTHYSSPLTPTSFGQGWLRCDEDLCPTVRDCVASLTGKTANTGSPSMQHGVQASVAVVRHADSGDLVRIGLSHSRSVPRLLHGSFFARKASPVDGCINKSASSRSLDLLRRRPTLAPESPSRRKSGSQLLKADASKVEATMAVATTLGSRPPAQAQSAVELKSRSQRERMASEDIHSEPAVTPRSVYRFDTPSPARPPSRSSFSIFRKPSGSMLHRNASNASCTAHPFHSRRTNMAA